MESDTCKKCGKKIEGYDKGHVEYMMKQHKMSKKCVSKKQEQ